MSQKKNRLKSPAGIVASSEADVVAAIAKIGERQRELTRIETEMNDRLAVIKAEYEDRAKTHTDLISDLRLAVQGWCEANRDRLTKSGKIKTYRFPTGEISWRLAPPKVSIRSVAAVMELLKQKGLHRFIRLKEEINKEAILATPDDVTSIPGIELRQDEDFIIVPFESRLEGAA
jgi:phage host-nuclease inhibitor protein Gam